MSAPHPDDERLSAAFDGHDDEAMAHAAGCADCRARLAAFEQVAALVATPVSAPPADEAIAAALRAATVVPLPRRRRGTVGLAVAAALVVVMGAVAVLAGGGDDGRDLAAVSDRADDADQSYTAGAAPVADLGDQADPSALADRLRAVVEPAAPEGAGPTSDAATESAPVAGLRATAGAPPGQCTDTATREYGSGLGPLVYRATLRWEGTPAVALVYQVAGASGALDHRVLVMATEGCRLLVVQSF